MGAREFAPMRCNLIYHLRMFGGVFVTYYLASRSRLCNSMCDIVIANTRALYAMHTCVNGCASSQTHNQKNSTNTILIRRDIHRYMGRPVTGEIRARFVCFGVCVCVHSLCHINHA